MTKLAKGTLHNGKPRKRAPGGGRKPKYTEPTVDLTIRLPQSLYDCAASLASVSPNNSIGGTIVEMAMESPQYRIGRDVASAD